jgi:hypothetical protein
MTFILPYLTLTKLRASGFGTVPGPKGKTDRTSTLSKGARERRRDNRTASGN